MNNKLEKITFLISIAYIAITTVLLLWYKALISPSQIFLVITFSVLVLTRLKDFIFSIPTALFIGYEYLGGLVPKLTSHANIYLMPYFDQKFFGTLPTIYLQNIFFANAIHWYDYVAVVVYLMHTVPPVLALLIFYKYDKSILKKYSVALLILSCVSFITYILFPAMPPWLASQKGLIPPVARIMQKLIDLKGLYQIFGVYLIAPVPSLHAAYPWLTFLFFWEKFKSKSLFFLPYVFAVWFSVIYLGEHYVFDILMGILYSTIVYFSITKLERR